MRRSHEFLVRKVAQQYVMVPVGEAAEKFTGMITINATGKFLWDLLEQEQTVETLAQALADTYQISKERALQDVEVFLKPIRTAGAITE